MKLLIILTFAILWAGVYSSAEDDNYDLLSNKEKMRNDILRELERFRRLGISSYCAMPLEPEQIVLFNDKLDELVQCANSTVDKFMATIDDDIQISHNSDIANVVRKLSTPVCHVFDDIFTCISHFEPVIDCCLDHNEKIWKNKLFSIVPLIHETICLRNGALIADIVEHADGLRCLERTFHSIVYIGVRALFDENEASELFGDQTVCHRFNTLLLEVYKSVGECSPAVLEMVKDMLGFFCKNTHCERFVADLQCF